jgi:hypothetical protein
MALISAGRAAESPATESPAIDGASADDCFTAASPGAITV